MASVVTNCFIKLIFADKYLRNIFLCLRIKRHLNSLYVDMGKRSANDLQGFFVGHVYFFRRASPVMNVTHLPSAPSIEDVIAT